MSLIHQDVLERVELFKELSEEEQELVLDFVTEHRFRKGETVFFEGETCTNVYFVVDGLVKLSTMDLEGRQQIVDIVGNGKMFPQIGLFEKAVYNASAETIVSTTLLVMRRDRFEDLLVAYPNMMRKVMRAMGRSIQKLQAKVHELALFDGHQRIYALLRHFAEDYGVIRADGIHVRVPVTNTELAQMVGLSRGAVNRIWNELRREGYVTGAKDEWVLQRDWYDTVCLATIGFQSTSTVSSVV